MYKFGTVKELNSVNIPVPDKVYQEVFIVKEL